jgi:hypothetical protein
MNTFRSINMPSFRKKEPLSGGGRENRGQATFPDKGCIADLGPKPLSPTLNTLHLNFMKILTVLLLGLLVTAQAASAASARPFKGRYQASFTLRTLSGEYQDLKFVNIQIASSGRVKGFLLEPDGAGGYAPSAQLRGKVTGVHNEFSGKPVVGVYRWLGRLNLRAPAGLRFKLSLRSAASSSPTHSEVIIIEGTARQGAYSADVDFKTL